MTNYLQWLLVEQPWFTTFYKDWLEVVDGIMQACTHAMQPMNIICQLSLHLDASCHSDSWYWSTESSSTKLAANIQTATMKKEDHTHYVDNLVLIIFKDYKWKQGPKVMAAMDCEVPSNIIKVYKNYWTVKIKWGSCTDVVSILCIVPYTKKGITSFLHNAIVQWSQFILSQSNRQLLYWLQQTSVKMGYTDCLSCYLCFFNAQYVEGNNLISKRFRNARSFASFPSLHYRFSRLGLPTMHLN